MKLQGFLKFNFLNTVIFIVCSGCTTELASTSTGILKGKINIGPLCPVETVPPQPGCKPTLETYTYWQTAIWSKNKKAKIQSINPTVEGTFIIELPVGDYIADFEKPDLYKIGSNNLPVRFSITEKDSTSITIDIDTGIR